MPVTPTTPRVLRGEEALEEGHVQWEGVVRPSKGGHDVRGVTLDDDLLPRLLAASSVDGTPADPGWYLGALVRVTAELHRQSASFSPGDPIVQTRSGTWLSAARVDAVELVARAQVIEGVLHKSKGYFAIQGRLVPRSELAWALAPEGGKDGERVRLWGQPRLVVCAPGEQCVTDGVLPLFDVGRAERLAP